MGVPDRRTSHVNVGCFTGSSEPHQERPASPGQTSSSEGGELKEDCRRYRDSPCSSIPQESLLLFWISFQSLFLSWRTLTHKAGFAWIHRKSRTCHAVAGRSQLLNLNFLSPTSTSWGCTVAAPNFVSDKRQMFSSYYARGFVCRSNTPKSCTSNTVSTCWGTLVLKPRRAATYLEGDSKSFLDTWALQIWFPQLINHKQKGTWLSKEESYSTLPMTDEASSFSVGGAAELKQVM